MNEEQVGPSEGKLGVGGENLPESEYRFFAACRKEIASDAIYNQFLQLVNLYAKVGVDLTKMWRSINNE